MSWYGNIKNIIISCFMNSDADQTDKRVIERLTHWLTFLQIKLNDKVHQNMPWTDRSLAWLCYGMIFRIKSHHITWAFRKCSDLFLYNWRHYLISITNIILKNLVLTYKIISKELITSFSLVCRIKNRHFFNLASVY